MVLAREGRAAIGDLRYYADTRANAFATPLAQAQLGAALALAGDQPRADAMFRLAGLAAEAGEPEQLFRTDYGSGPRDAAGVLALAAEAGSDAVDRAALTGIVTAPGAERSTQEQLWTLLAAHALAGDAALELDPDQRRARRRPGAARSPPATCRSASPTPAPSRPSPSSPPSASRPSPSPRRATATGSSASS